MNPSRLLEPGAPVHRLRERIKDDLQSEFDIIAPKNDKRNATHRGGVVGTYRESLSFEQYGNQSGLGLRMVNSAPHADIVEFGRPATSGWEKFGWKKHKPAGAIRAHPKGTNGRDGDHVLRDCVNAVMPMHVDGFTPLP